MQEYLTDMPKWQATSNKLVISFKASTFYDFLNLKNRTCSKLPKKRWNMVQRSSSGMIFVSLFCFLRTSPIFSLNPSYSVHFRKFIKIKINLNFYLHSLCDASKSFMKAYKAFRKPFEALQRSAKIEIWFNKS